MGEDAAGELVGHLVESGRTEVVRGDEGKYGRAGVGGPVHVADVNFVERSFADAEHQRTFFFEADVSGAFDQVRGDAVCNAGKGSHAAGNNDHGVGGIRTTRNVSADISVGLLMDFAGRVSEHLAHQVATAAEFEFFGNDAQGAAGGDEVDRLNAFVAFDSEQQVAEEQRPAGAGGGDGEILRWVGQLGGAPEVGGRGRPPHTCTSCKTPEHREPSAESQGRIRMKTASNPEGRRSAAQMHGLAAVRRELGPRDSASGRKYLREFAQAFRRYDAVLDTEQLNSKIVAADILLVGDYHALPASQRFATGLIEQVAHGRPVVLGLEAVLARDQRILEAWWRREIGEEELRQRLRFDREWGYDWDPCYELLTAARDHAEGIYGLDCMPRDDLRRIGGRDRHAAAKICEMRENHPGAFLVVLFGESHMAPQHLPRIIKEAAPEARILTVLQNLDALYWQAVEEQAAVVRIGEDAVCVFNSSPLEKYESYRLCFEKWNGAADDLPDFAPAVYNLIFSLAKSLGFRLDSPRNGTQPKYLADSLPEVVSVKEVASVADEDARAALEERGCVFVPATNTFLVREFQMAQAAEQSSRFLHHACRGMRAQPGPLSRQVENALAYFGSRLLCPAVGLESVRGSETGEALYQAYIAGRVTKAALRRAYLTPVEDSEQAQKVLATMQAAR